MLHQSSQLARLCAKEVFAWNYTINDNDYTTGYYLCDGIYSSWMTFIKTIFELSELKMMWRGYLERPIPVLRLFTTAKL